MVGPRLFGRLVDLPPKSHVRRPLIILRLSILCTVAVLLAILISCGGDDPKSGPTEGRPSEPAAVVTQDPPTPRATVADQQGVRKPTSRDDSRSQSGGAGKPKSATPNVKPVQGAGGSEEKKKPGNGSPDAGLIPENLQFTDGVLLQDIYARMDLDQFALDPEAPIPFPVHRSGAVATAKNLSPSLSDSIPGTFDYLEVREHPFLHLFPGLKYLVDQADAEGAPKNGMIEYDPFMELDTEGERGTMKFDFVPRDGISRFIYNPWFEPISGYEYDSWLETSVDLLDRYRFSVQGPHWFGNNSTRGVLANVVTGALEDAKYDRVENVDFPWATRKREVEDVSWSLADYLRTPVRQPRDKSWDWDLQLREDTFVVPTTYWEFLHPKLPIVKVTSYNRTLLPLALEGQEPTPTAFAVSFVISFQNRWASFEDPDRWLIRFERELFGQDTDIYRKGKGLFGVSQGAVDPEIHGENFPNYWHNTDYMQHELIGPVVVQVYESDVIQPASMWSTPGSLSGRPPVTWCQTTVSSW